MTHDPAADESMADCRAVLARLYQFLDGECGEAEADDIRGHLDACDRCVEDADVALALKALIQRCCRAVTAPTTLRSTILTTYRSTTVTPGGIARIQYSEITRVSPPL